jgi:hypothetical protein
MWSCLILINICAFCAFLFSYIGTTHHYTLVLGDSTSFHFVKLYVRSFAKHIVKITKFWNIHFVLPECANQSYRVVSFAYMYILPLLFKGALQSFFTRKATLSWGLHGDSFGCILHAVSMSMSTSAHRKTHACRGAHVK